MKVIAVTSQKGGTGKTTLSGHLAVQAERAGMGPVVMVDCDPQGSLTNWWNYRQVETPILVQTSLAKLGEDLESLRESDVQLDLDVEDIDQLTAICRDTLGSLPFVLQTVLTITIGDGPAFDLIVGGEA